MPKLSSHAVPDWLSTLIDQAKSVDGQPPFSDQSLVDVDLGNRELVAIGEDAAAIAGASEAELVVRPGARRRGLGTALVTRLLQRSEVRPLIWAHGDHPDARSLAKRFGFVPVRRLLQLRRTDAGQPGRVPSRTSGAVAGTGTMAGTGSVTGSRTVVAFRPGVDDAEWLELNARAFANHPEQGSFTAADLEARRKEDWFDADDFLLLRDESNAMIGFCWLKVEGPIGEFYVVGVDPEHQGAGLGRVLVEAGLDRLVERGIASASLYVEADNDAALRLYRSFGFTEFSVDIQYGSAEARVQ